MVHRSVRVTDVFHRSFVKAGFSFLAIAILSASSCPTEADKFKCGAKDEYHLDLDTPAQALTSPNLEVTLSNGVRTFSWAQILENVCSEEEVYAAWHIRVTPDKLPPGWHLDAGYVITPVLGSVVTMKPTEGNQLREYEGSAYIGLSQAFNGAAGRFLVFLDISFTSQGNLETDRAVAQSLLQWININVYYSQPGIL